MKILQRHNYYKSRGGEVSAVNAEKELFESKEHEVIQLFSDNISLIISVDGFLKSIPKDGLN